MAHSMGVQISPNGGFLDKKSSHKLVGYQKRWFELHEVSCRRKNRFSPASLGTSPLISARVCSISPTQLLL